MLLPGSGAIDIMLPFPRRSRIGHFAPIAVFLPPAAAGTSASTWGARAMIETAACRMSRAGVVPRPPSRRRARCPGRCIAQSQMPVRSVRCPAVSSKVSHGDGARSPQRRRFPQCRRCGRWPRTSSRRQCARTRLAFLWTWPRTPGPGGRICCDRPAGHARRAGSSVRRSSGATAAVQLRSRHVACWPA